MSPATAGRHLSILEASLLIHRLTPHFANIGKRFVKSPKLYWSDTGLCAHILGYDEPRGSSPTDLVEIGRHRLLFEVKASRTATADDAQQIERWLQLQPDHGPGTVLYAGEEYLPVSKNVRAIPVGLLFARPD